MTLASRSACLLASLCRKLLYLHQRYQWGTLDLIHYGSGNRNKTDSNKSTELGKYFFLTLGGPATPCPCVLCHNMYSHHHGIDIFLNPPRATWGKGVAPFGRLLPLPNIATSMHKCAIHRPFMWLQKGFKCSQSSDIFCKNKIGHCGGCKMTS